MQEKRKKLFNDDDDAVRTETMPVTQRSVSYFHLFYLSFFFNEGRVKREIMNETVAWTKL